MQDQHLGRVLVTRQLLVTVLGNNEADYPHGAAIIGERGIMQLPSDPPEGNPNVTNLIGYPGCNCVLCLLEGSPGGGGVEWALDYLYALLILGALPTPD